MKVMTTVFVLGLLVAGRVWAECPEPDGSIQIPSGAAATRDEMVAAQKAVKAYDIAVRAYTACLEREEQSRASSGVDRARLAEEYGRRNDIETDKLEKLADKFNAELRAFKARNTD